MLDPKRFNGFVRDRLDDKLFDDLWNLDIFKERDMHSAAYFYVRGFFQRRKRGDVYVRCEPRIRGFRPDLVVFERGNPIYAVEFKMFTEPERIDEELVFEDVMKLHDLIGKVPTIRWGFVLVIYDADAHWTMADQRLRRRGFEKVSVTIINARRKEESGRRRTGYDEWRREFERLRTQHEQYA